MTDLIKQLEAATEGSRTLDYEIARELQWRFSEEEEFKEFGSFWRDAMTDEWKQLPWWTTSIDAALTLVPEGLRWTLGYEPTGKLNYWAWVWTDDGPCEAYKPTPALVLCIAILKALAK